MNDNERPPAGGLPAGGLSNLTTSVRRPAGPRVERPTRPLAAELGSLVRLRWGVGAGVLLAAGLARIGRGWDIGPEQAGGLAAVGGVILAYNAVLWLTLRRFAG